MTEKQGARTCAPTLRALSCSQMERTVSRTQVVCWLRCAMASSSWHRLRRPLGVFVPRWTPDAARTHSSFNGSRTARQPRQRIERSGVREAWRIPSVNPAGSADDHRDGQPHPARLRDGLGGCDPAGVGPGDFSLPKPPGVRALLNRSTVDAGRAGGPRTGIGSRDGIDVALGPGYRRRR